MDKTKKKSFELHIKQVVNARAICITNKMAIRSQVKELEQASVIPDAYIMYPTNEFKGLFLVCLQDDQRLGEHMSVVVRMLREAKYYVSVCYGEQEISDEIHDYFDGSST